MYKILLQQFIKQFGRVPSALEKILLKQKATKQAIDQRKVLDLKGNPIDPSKPIIGGKNVTLTNKEKIDWLVKNVDPKAEQTIPPKATLEAMLKDGREDLIDHFFKMHTKKIGSKPQIKIDTSDLKHPELVAGIMRATKQKPTLATTKGISDKAFKDQHLSFRLNIAKNSREFNQDLANKIIKREIYKDFSDVQRKQFLDDLTSVLKEPLAGGGLAGMLGEPTFQDEDHRVPYGTGKRVTMDQPSDVTTSGLLDINFDNLDLEEWFEILKSLGVSEHASGGRVSLKGGKKVVQGLAKLMDEFFPGTTKIGKRSKPYPEKVQEKMDLRKAIADFQERQKAAKLKELKTWEDPDKVRAAVDDIFSTGDYKMDAQMASEALVENNPKAFGNKLFDDLDDKTRTKIYGAVLDVVQSDLGKMLKLKRASKPTKTLEGIKKTGTIDISDPNIAEEFTRFMKETNPKGHKKIEEIVELSNFDIKGKKGHADGGRVPMWMGGGLGAGKGLLREIMKHHAKTGTTGLTGSKMLQLVNPKQFNEMLNRPEGIPAIAKEMIEKYIKEMKADRIGAVEHSLGLAKKMKKSKDKLKEMDKITEKLTKEFTDKGMDKKMVKDLVDMFINSKYPDVLKIKALPNITDEAILELENIGKNLATKGRKLNASGGLAGMLGE